MLAFGFVALFAISLLAYRNAPPISGQKKNANSTATFITDDIRSGQALFCVTA